MVILAYEPENYIDDGMAVEVYGGAEGMGYTFNDRKGEPGSDGKKYINGVVAV